MKSPGVALVLLSLAFGEPVKPFEAHLHFPRRFKEDRVANLLGKKRAVQLGHSQASEEINLADQSEALEEISLSITAAFNEVRTALRGIDAKCRELGDEFAAGAASQQGSITDLDTQHLQNKGLASRYEAELHQLTKQETETQASYDSSVFQRAHERQAYLDWRDGKEVQGQGIDEVLEVLRNSSAVVAVADGAAAKPASLGGSSSSGLDYIIGLFSSMKDGIVKEMEEEVGKHTDGDASLRNVVVGYKKTLQHVDAEYEVVDGHRVTAQARITNIEYEISMREVFVENYQTVSDILRGMCGRPRDTVLSEGERYLSDLQRQVGLLIPAINKMPPVGVAEDGPAPAPKSKFLQSPGQAKDLHKQQHQASKTSRNDANKLHARAPARMAKGHALASDALRAVHAAEKAAIVAPLPTLEPPTVSVSAKAVQVAPASLPHATLAKRVRHTVVRAARGSAKGWQILLRAAQATNPALSSAMAKLQNGDGSALRALVARTSHGKLVTNEQDLLKFYRTLEAQEPAEGEAGEQANLDSDVQHCVDEKQRLTGEIIAHRQTSRQARATRDASLTKAKAVSAWHQDVETELSVLSDAKAGMQTAWQPLQDTADTGSFASTLEDGFSDLGEIEAEVAAYSEHEDAPPSAAGLSTSIDAIRQSATGLQESLSSVSDAFFQAYNSFQIAAAAKVNSLNTRVAELQALEGEETKTATSAAEQYNIFIASEHEAIDERVALEESCENAEAKGK